MGSSDRKILHPRAFLVSVVWTLVLLFLGSVVHATGSSLACPDWPTCFGSMVPEMSGGIFWEHLHRLVAGGLILIFGLGAVLSWREERVRRWIPHLAVAGLVLLLIQALLGGLTVLMELPPAVSTLHLTAALLFLGVTAILALATHPSANVGSLDPHAARQIRSSGVAASVLVLIQSVLGALVRHLQGGMACPDLPLCLGEWIPPLHSPPIAAHFAHRVMAVVVLIVLLWLGTRLMRAALPSRVRWLGGALVGGVLLQAMLGIVSVATFLSVPAVSLHTLVAALLFILALGITWLGHEGGKTPTGTPPRTEEATVRDG